MSDKKQRIESVIELINEFNEDDLVSLLWWLKKNPDAINDFIKEKVCAHDILVQFRENKKYTGRIKRTNGIGGITTL